VRISSRFSTQKATNTDCQSLVNPPKLRMLNCFGNWGVNCACLDYAPIHLEANFNFKGRTVLQDMGNCLHLRGIARMCLNAQAATFRKALFGHFSPTRVRRSTVSIQTTSLTRAGPLIHHRFLTSRTSGHCELILPIGLGWEFRMMLLSMLSRLPRFH
jgi:hypothetical protein